MPETVRETLVFAKRYLASGEDPETAELDAQLLLARALGIDRAKLFAVLADPMSDRAMSELKRLLDLRRSGYPLAYIGGFKEFYGRDFAVNEDVLIPRPETEILVEWVLETLRDWPEGPGAVPGIHDCCTGSGCVAITLALEAAISGKKVSVSASDLSEAALAQAARNAESLKAPVVFYRGNLLDIPELTEKAPYDFICANPPYVSSNDLPEGKSSRWKEPVLALDGGSDGLDLIKKLIVQAHPLLKEGGFLFLEIGFDQSSKVCDFAQKNGYILQETRKDLASLDRTVRLKKGIDRNLLKKN